MLNQEELNALLEVYHISDNDLDGVSCLMVSDHCFEQVKTIEKVQKVPSRTRSIDEMVKEFVNEKWNKDTLLLITDLSVDTVEVAELIDEKVKEGYKAMLIDHHGTAEWLNKYDWAKVVTEIEGVKTSATSLLYDELSKMLGKEQVLSWKAFTEHVRAYDTWDWYNVGIGTDERGNVIPNTTAKQLNDYLFMVAPTEFQEVIWNALEARTQQYYQTLKNPMDAFQLPEDVSYLLTVEKSRLDAYNRKKEAQMVQKEVLIDETVYQVGLVLAEQNISELGNQLCENNPNIDFVAITDIGKKKISLRSRNEAIDVSKIAKHFGGGGHPRASGADLTNETYLMFVQALLPVL